MGRAHTLAPYVPVIRGKRLRKKSLYLLSKTTHTHSLIHSRLLIVLCSPCDYRGR